MNIFLWALIGLTAGWIASIISGAESFRDSFPSIVVGTIGALLGGFYVRAMDMGSSNFHPASVVLALIGALILVTGYKAVKDKR